jgi:hypothetical protein
MSSLSVKGSASASVIGGVATLLLKVRFDSLGIGLATSDCRGSGEFLVRLRCRFRVREEVGCSTLLVSTISDESGVARKLEDPRVCLKDGC